MVSRVEHVERVEGESGIIADRHEQWEAHENRGKSAASEVFGCISHGRGAYRESDSFAMWAVHHGVTVSMTTVSISSDPFTLVVL